MSQLFKDQFLSSLCLSRRGCFSIVVEEKEVLMKFGEAIRQSQTVGVHVMVRLFGLRAVGVQLGRD